MGMSGDASDPVPEHQNGPAVSVRSMYRPLLRVAMRRPGAILTVDPVRWHYAKRPDPAALVDQYQRFVDLVTAEGADVVWIDGDDEDGSSDGLADSIFTYDPSFVVGEGAVILRPGKRLREPEADLHAAFYRRLGVPVLGRIEPPGTVEGGDLFWLDETTLAAGRGFRTNQLGLDQLAGIVGPVGVRLEVFDLPYHHGPEACLHLLSVISPLDRDLALVHAPLLPTALHQQLTERGWRLLAAPPDEFEASSGLNLNVLATGPRRGIAVAGFGRTLDLLRSAGCRIATFPADELCLPCEGGPTCLTRPLLRAG